MEYSVLHTRPAPGRERMATHDASGRGVSGLVLELDIFDWDNQINQAVESLGGLLGGKKTKYKRRYTSTPVLDALRRAVRKTTKWLEGQIVRFAAREIGITQKRFRGARVRLRVDHQGMSIFGRDRIFVSVGNIWVGIDAIEAHLLGDVSWNRSMIGARAGKRVFPGAFVAREKIRRRMGKARLPLMVERVPVDLTIEQNLAYLEERAAHRYRTILIQELNFELAKHMGRA